MKRGITQNLPGHYSFNEFGGAIHSGKRLDLDKEFLLFCRRAEKDLLMPEAQKRYLDKQASECENCGLKCI